MTIPTSTIVMKDLKPLFIKGVQNKGFFVSEEKNRNNTSVYKDFFPTMKIIGCKKKNKFVKKGII